jgi:hypothetical protein
VEPSKQVRISFTGSKGVGTEHLKKAESERTCEMITPHTPFIRSLRKIEKEGVGQLEGKVAMMY